MERTLLLVDDEQNILSALLRLLRRDGYTILTAGGGKAGLEMLEKSRVGVIVSDQRMPEMTGVEFLSIVKERHPETVRIVLSGYSDITSITDAINQGAIYKFLTKPWDDELLRRNIQEAFRAYEMAQENERLTLELRTANDTLTQINQGLALRDEQKSRELMLQLRLLRISQEVLDHLPVAVLGVGDEGIVAIANRMAHELLRRTDGSLVGLDAAEILPQRLVQLCRAEADEPPSAPTPITLDDGRAIEIRCRRLGQTSHAHGAIVVITPAS